MSVLHHCTKNIKADISDFAYLWHCEDFNASVGYTQYGLVILTTAQKKFGSKSVDPKYP